MSGRDLTALLVRPACWVAGHKWSDWHSDGYMLPVGKHRPGQQNRFCWRCDLDQFRPEPAAEVEAAGAIGWWTEEAAPAHAIPVHETSDYALTDGGRWNSQFFTEALPEPLVPPPPGYFDNLRTALRDMTARPVMPVVPRARVVNRDVMGDAVAQIGASVQALQAAPEHERQLEATREMLADIGRQLDEVTTERDELRKEREIGLPPSVVELQRKLDTAQQQLEEITRDRDRLSDVSGRRLAQTRTLEGEIRTLQRALTVAGRIIAHLSPDPDRSITDLIHLAMQEDQADEHPVTARPDRC